jgi:acyl transferase domain-containing protein/NADPH:quinone reductase-like Zn-dependent oxidoreductase
MSSDSIGYDIAVVGVAGRFPGARNAAEFWRNLCDGVESVKFFTDAELLAAGESPESLNDPLYVRAQPVLDDFDRFDAGFFGFSPQDAAVMDPQHRVFLETGWEALEDAGHVPDSFPGNIGVFATCGMNTYMMFNLVNNRRVMDNIGEWLVRHTGNDMNFLATRLSYELDLKGPSMNVQTACSSALVAVHLACQSLLTRECDMALAGGATIVLPQHRGYLYKPNEILSPDGHCRTFDAKARGTLFGSGAGVVVLRRLADALADGDRVIAVVKGSAINNDGSGKVGYLAPSVDGQSRAITEALTVSGAEADTISYVEAHGTGTIVGDPIEVVALTQAFRQFTQRNGFCALGSVKSNIGHLGEAAGAAAFIKTALALQHQTIPPSLNFESPNPQIDFPSSPFYVNSRLAPWPALPEPRRAGITSLGAGGTNCHVILEEPPVLPETDPSRHWQLLLLSAATATALESATENLAAYLKQQPDLNLSDVAYTLHAGRKAFEHRRAFVCRDRAEAIAACATKQGMVTASAGTAERKVAFLFPGQGAQFPNMGRGLYDTEPIFRAAFDESASALKRERGLDLHDILYSSRPVAHRRNDLNQTAWTQPALFSIEYALARLWMSWGVTPSAMLGHSIGEYVAACLAGVFTLSDAIALVADRGSLMQQAPRGVMLAVALPAGEVEELLTRRGAELSLCVVNSPDQAVIGGPESAVAEVEADLTARSVQCRRLDTSHAFHCAMMEPILARYAERVRRVRLNPPVLPYVSNLTGTWIQPVEVTNPDYWVRHLRNTVRFSECLATLLANPDQVLLEVGPGRTLGGLARQQPVSPVAVVASLGRDGEEARDGEFVLRAYGQLWTHGCKLDAARLYEGQRRRRVALPAYPFERQRYWIDPDPPAAAPTPEARRSDEAAAKKSDLADWFYLPTWKRALPPPLAVLPPDAPRDWLVFLDESGLGAELVEHLRTSSPGATNGDPGKLEIAEPGDVESLTLRPDERRLPGPGEVEIRVATAALNFADVLKASGVFEDAPFGMECAGVIERVGPGVTDFKPGDEVVAIGPGSFRTFLVRQARHVARKPAFLSMEDAVTLPAAFMTVWHAVHHVGKLRKGEKLLIHAASGGVGLAAVQVARRTGAEIYATAGNKEKRAYLKSHGVRHVFDSRDPGFAEEILKHTRGRGVDLVLNSLTGEFIPKSFSVLAAGGRFLELGKREIYTPIQLAALSLRPNVTYHPINLVQILDDDPDAYGRLLREVIGQAEQRRIEPLPRHDFPFVEAAAAFRLMLQTRHIGKVVLTTAPARPTVCTVRAGAAFRQSGPNDFVLRPGNADDYGSLLEALERGPTRVGRVVHLWNVTAGADQKADLEKRLERSFFSLTWLAKALSSRDWSHPLDLTILSTGLHQVGGDDRNEPAKATLLGPCGVIPRENANVTCRSIDVPPTAAGTWPRARLLQQLLAELHGEPCDRVVAYRNAERLVQDFELAPLQPARGGMPLRRGGTYLVTGGLGGLGLALADHLARSVQANLVLVGRSSLPARTEWDSWLRSHDDQDPVGGTIRRLQVCEAAGGNVLVATADVTDRVRMRAVVADARNRFGTIHGVIHAAGALDDGLIQLKSRASAFGVLAPKVNGTLVLDEVFAGQPLDFFVLFSSISSVLGLQGQVDYTAANAFLDAFAASRSARCPGQTVAINWSAWQEVGMAARSIGPARGPHRGSAAAPRPRHPWLERRLDEDGRVAFVTAFSRARQWLLDEHAVRGGDALIPGTGFLELARAAFAEVSDSPAVEIIRVVFQTPFAVARGETKELTLSLRPAATGWDFAITSQAGSVTHVTGHVGPTSKSLPERMDVAMISASCGARAEVLDGFLRQSFMDFGPRWGNVRHIRFGRDEALLSLELPDALSSELENFLLHPALLDMATGGAQPLISGFEPARDFYVPFSYGRLTLWGGFTRRLHSHVRLREAKSQGVALFDVTVADEHGNVLAEITDFLMKKVSHLATGQARSSAATLAGEILQNGIATGEGIQAFERILACGVAPQVIVSPVDPHLWARKAEAPPASTKPLGRAGTGAKPSRNGAPQGDQVEQRLKELYSQILGVENVGPRDDFFELGGHSLLAVRLLTRIEKEFQKAIPLAELFQHPTIEFLATALRGTAAPKHKAMSVIVPFNEQGESPPLYLVHSVGGEVASFRHLARLLGPEIRLYGIQAPPEQQNAEFAASIEEVARHYVDAITAFQPEGPLLLGGWSAGSTIALEMAQRLTAAGRSVELLVALDGAPFNTGTGTRLWHPLYYWKLARNVPRWVADDLLLDFSLSVFARRVRNKAVALLKKTSATLQGQREVRADVNGFMDTSYYSTTHAGFMNALFHALCTYVPKPYAGRVLLYKSRTQPLYHLLEVEPAWRKIATRVDAVEVRGTHVSIVREPYILPIAEDLRQRLHTAPARKHVAGAEVSPVAN